MSKFKNLDNINLLRALGIVLVVLRHSFAPFIGSWKLDYNFDFNYFVVGKYISTFSMPLFVCISGYTFGFLRIQLHKYRNFKEFIYKKYKRLLIPFLLLAPIYVITFNEVVSFKIFIRLLFNSPGHFWFLLMLFLVFSIFYLFEKKFREKIKFSIVFTSLLFCLYPLFGYLQIIPISNLCKYLPFFYCGYLFFLKQDKISNILKDRNLIIITTHLILFCSYIYLESIETKTILIKILTYYSILPLGILSICFLFSIFAFKKIDSKVLNNKLIKLINTNSYYIYIIHEPILKLYYLNNLGLLSNFKPILILLGFFSSMILSIFLSKILLKSKYGKLLVGA
ncbi:MULTISPECIES: acyltransferase family protein [Cellulophaga]|uniref:acyltransferase family protein n=1 Tax=Cellulophaga TaxID=104264 RepID=UPI000400B608|nr:hypothetical protein M667_12385 [Cellulophaga baltica NN016038]KGK29139.1 hypothetical protein EL45_17980 [Cellulophaga sp. E6(2014)]